MKNSKEMKVTITKVENEPGPDFGTIMGAYITGLMEYLKSQNPGYKGDMLVKISIELDESV